MRIEVIQPGNPLKSQLYHSNNPPTPAVSSFRDTFSAFLTKVNDTQKAASEAQQNLLSGETTDVHQVMMKSEEANVSFNMLMELRNKAMDGYQEIMRTRL